MDNSVATIIEMDRKARAAAEEASRKAEAILADARRKKEQTAAENAEKLAAQTEALMSGIRSASDKDISEAEKKADEKCRILDEKMAAGKDAWKKEIKDRILSLD